MKNKVLVISNVRSSFVRQDMEVLRRYGAVEFFEYDYRTTRGNFISQIKLLFWLLSQIGRARLVYVWFADYHALLPALIAKLSQTPFFVVIGGYDAAKIKAFKYGAHLNPLRSLCVSIACRLATRILPVSAFTANNLFKNIPTKLKAKSTIVYNGAMPEHYFCKPDEVKRPEVLCVSGAANERTVKIKGIDFYVAVARAMPEVHFTLAGLSGAALSGIAADKPVNLTILRWVQGDDLRKLMAEAKVICQFSRSETFGLAVAEAMLCECVPVTVAGIGTAEIVSPTVGYVIDKLDITQAVQAVKQALATDVAQGQAARQHIMDHFTLEKRGKKLIAILDTYIEP